jgi:hypothetical protein
MQVNRSFSICDIINSVKGTLADDEGGLQALRLTEEVARCVTRRRRESTG